MVRVTSRTMETTVARTGRLTIAGLVMLAGQTAPSLAAPRDEFYWMTEINKASAVMLAGAKERLDADHKWLEATRTKLDVASQKLDQAFASLHEQK